MNREDGPTTSIMWWMWHDKSDTDKVLQGP